MNWQMKSIIEELQEKKEGFLKRYGIKNPEFVLAGNMIQVLDGEERYAYSHLNGYEINGKKLSQKEMEFILKSL